MVDVIIMKAVSADNQRHAEVVRKIYDDHKILGLNFVSSPGAGKTTLLEKTIADNPDITFGVIEGDVYTARDAKRIEKTGAFSVQLNTEGSCHLTAEMVENAIPKFKLDEIDIMVVENIGNLICPAAYALGEHKRVVLLSTPEGSDKVLKYPEAFAGADLVLITKVDIAEAVNFDLEVVIDDLKAVNPKVEPWELSVVSGVGLERWYGWLKENLMK
jgi:hydrogenase nickel incorporation protein HypB